MAGGRPTTYDDELLAKAWEYANGGWTDQGKIIPSVVGLCSYINRSRSIVYDWAADPEKQFSDILCTISEKQEEELILNGLDSTFNSTIAKLMLTKHGYTDKIDTNQNSTALTHEEWLNNLDE